MNLDRFNLNLFVALDAVLSARNLTEAAKSIFLTQPALSVALKKLRQHYGDELVIYAGGETKLTPLAEELKPRIKELIQASKDTLKLSLRFDPSTSTQTFRIVTTDILELTYMKDVLGEIAREAPGVTVILLPFAYEPVEMLFRGNVDLTIVSEAFGSERFAHEPLFEDTFSCVIWEGNSTVGETLSREDYFNLRHAALYQSPERLTHPFAMALAALSTQRHATIRTSTLQALPHVVVGTELVATMPTRFARSSAQTLPLRVLPVPLDLPPIKFAASWQAYRTHEPGLVWLRDKLRRHAAAL